jgi:alginate O-acetyltransferase complex protein AlgI
LFIFWFLPAALALYYAAPRRARHLALAASSYIFYGWANPAFVPLMLASTLIDYVAGLVIAPRTACGEPGRVEAAAARSARQKAALAVALTANLALLGVFKYANLVIDTWLAIAGKATDPAEALFRITLPLGISFYTFQSMSYTIDVYRGKTKAISSFIDFACFVSMFPQLVAGPIIRFQEVADQLAHRKHTVQKFARGWAFFTLGLAKKVLLANPCGTIADLAFDNAPVPCADAWLGLAAYSFQIYFDFSGYSDMAIGLGLMFGFMFPKNFDGPYRSTSFTEFWRRWHISLSTWLRDYLYFSLGGNRKGTVRTYVNLLLVMLLGGLWHGAAWNFVLWGGMHGGLLAAERALRGWKPGQRLPGAARTAATFALVTLCWIPFRAPGAAAAWEFARSMAGLAGLRDGAWLVSGATRQPFYLATLTAAAVVTWLAPQTWQWTQRLTLGKGALAAALFVLATLVLSLHKANPFIYFIF